jgi:hypothetical protein
LEDLDESNYLKVKYEMDDIEECVDDRDYL